MTTMDVWVPNPKAKLYKPKSRGIMWTLCRPCLSRRKVLVQICKGCLLVILLVTVVINISFIMETNRKLQLEDLADNQPDDSAQTRNYGNNHHDNTVIEMSAGNHGNQGRSIIIEIVSSKLVVMVKVDGKTLLHNEIPEDQRGIHILVLNQATGKLMAQRVFDTYQKGEDANMLSFLSSVAPGRVMIFAIKDEGSFHLLDEARQVLTSMGSKSVTELGWRDMWAFVTFNGTKFGEMKNKSPDLGSWADPVTLKVNVTLSSVQDSECKSWPKTEASVRRAVFCRQYEGYGRLCSCTDPELIEFPHTTLENGAIFDVPVSVIASNRPQYLYRMLKTLLQTPGVPLDKITVFIDGDFHEPLAITRLLNLRGIQHVPSGVKNARISQHYKASITATFNFFIESQYIILIEEDLEVSPDFFNYFHQTMPLLEDPTLYCISAWNDQGYDHSCKDPSLLYRIETMPGLGWMMKRSLYKDELEPQWPSRDKGWDWDMWMRHDAIRKSRECIIPDVSRTFHFGSKGLNINPYFQELYFQKHTLQSQPNVKLKQVDRMQSDKYETLIKDLIKSAKVLDHTIDPCAENFIPETKDETYVMYIRMKTATDFETWKMLAKDTCYKLWDLDVRGFHKSMWRQFHKGKHLVIVGVPASPYSEFKPKDVTPIYLQDKKENQR